MTDLCAMVLAAGEGTRLRPLTRLRPKPLCPVGNVPLIDRALARVTELGLTGPTTVAVNASWLGEQVAAHVGDRAHLSLEGSPLGTAGGVGRLRGWIDGRPVLVGNADAYLAGGTIDRLLAGWDGETVRLLGVPATPAAPGTFSGRVGPPGGATAYEFAGFSLLPWCWVRDLREDSGELVTAVWRPAEAAGAVEVVAFTGYFRDTGTPAGYLAANLHAAGGDNLVAPDAEVTGACRQAVIGAGAVVHGSVTRGVVWPGGVVGSAEHLTDAVRAGTDLTVYR